VGRYILSPRIFRYLDKVVPGKGGEIQLTDAIFALLEEERMLALPFEGVRYDCGNKLGYLQATLAYATRHPDVGREFSAYLQQFCEQQSR
jgi:UTP--glucose-1-phosphate uridylyltransferase